MLEAHNQISHARDVLRTSGITEYSLSDDEEDTDQFPLPPSSDPLLEYISSFGNSDSNPASSAVSSSGTCSVDGKDDIGLAEYHEEDINGRIQRLARMMVKNGMV